MQKLRSIHLYLGCVFAPLLLFFAASGFWQTLNIRLSFLNWLSLVHTGFEMKNGAQLSSYPFRIFVAIMASFVITTLLGIIMAMRFARSRKAAIASLALGILVPLLILVTFSKGATRTLTINDPNSPTMKLADAAAKGDLPALNALNDLSQKASTARSPIEIRDQMNALRNAFSEVGSRAAAGDDAALEALFRATQLDYIRSFAHTEIGRAASNGNQRALKALFEPVGLGITASQSLAMLQGAADAGNATAIEAIAKHATNFGLQSDVIKGLRKAATIGGNGMALHALETIAASSAPASAEAEALLRSAASNHVAGATEILERLKR